MNTKHKKIIDRYMTKHPNATPEKIEEYAKKKGIHISVMAEVEHRILKNKMMKDLGIEEELDLDNPEDQKKLMDAIENLTPDKKAEYLKQVK